VLDLTPKGRCDFYTKLEYPQLDSISHSKV